MCWDGVESMGTSTFLMRAFLVHNRATLSTHEKYRFPNVISSYWVSPYLGLSIGQLCPVFMYLWLRLTTNIFWQFCVSYGLLSKLYTLPSFYLPSCINALSYEQLDSQRQFLRL